MSLGIYFFPVFKAVFVILVVALVSGLMFRKNIITHSHIEGLSHIVVLILLPCLSFSKIIQYFKPQTSPYWWLLPLIALAMIGLGLLVSGLFYYNKISQSKKYIALAAFMNANYMVLPIGQLAFPDQFDSFATYTFLFVLGVNPALWSIGKYLITDKDNTQFSLKQLFSPPFAAILLAVVLVLTGMHTYIPELIMEPIDFIADAAVPAATLVLGATIGSVSLRKLPPLADILKVTATKLFILPLITIVFLKYTQLLENNSLLADLLVIEAAVAPASSLVIQVRKYGGDSQNVGYIMFITYILCLLTIPAWFSFWKFIQ
ncbi:MAG: AEC family transporter [Salinivirgaceae bacterium]|jgi:hypothetical protein